MKKKELNFAIGQFFKKKRLNKGLLLKNVSIPLGICDVALCHKEHGRSTFFPWEIGIICQVLDIDVSEVSALILKSTNKHLL